MVHNFYTFAKALNGKKYKLEIKDTANPHYPATTIMVFGVLTRTKSVSFSKYGNSFDYTAKFLTQNDSFKIGNTSLTLVDEDNNTRYSMKLEYEKNPNGSNRLINNFNHRSFLLKEVN